MLTPLPGVLLATASELRSHLRKASSGLSLSHTFYSAAQKSPAQYPILFFISLMAFVMLRSYFIWSISLSTFLSTYLLTYLPVCPSVRSYLHLRTKGPQATAFIRPVWHHQHLEHVRYVCWGSPTPPPALVICHEDSQDSAYNHTHE